jgi:serine/threonine-protein kinase
MAAVQSVPAIDKRERDSMATGGPKDNPQFPLSKGDWERAKVLLTVAADLPQQERTHFVENHLPDDPTLSTTLLTLLETYDKTVKLGSKASLEAQETRIEVGGQYGKYHILQSLGRGGMGQVFLAEDIQIGRRVALKTLVGAWLDSPTARRQLLTEARAVAQLEHQNIVRLYEFFEDQQRFMLVMEYVEGRTGAVVVAEGPIPLGLAMRFAVQVCDAVVYAHDHGILHCDLKPANVQVTPDGTAKVLDFGLAQAKFGWYQSDQDAKENGPLLGTPAYMAPERLQGSPPKETSDIYSLGVTLFELVTGRRPFDEPHLAALTGAILETSPPKASSIAPLCPPRLDEIIDRAMAKDPKQRYQTARELSRDLNEVLKALDRDNEPFTESTRPAYSRSLWIALLLLGSFGSLTLIGFLTSTFYNSPMDITTAFEGESPIWWPYWGVRSLVLPLGQMGFAIVICGLAIQAWKMARDAFPPLRRGYQWILNGPGKLINRVRSFQTSTIAGILLVAQVVTLRLLWWRFEKIFDSFNSFVLRSGSLEALGPSYGDERQWYTRVFSLVVLAFGWSWYRLLKSQWQTRKPVGAINLAAGSVLIMLGVFAMVAPYRLFTKSKGERVHYQNQLCYQVGEKGDKVALFCPFQDPPWNMVVNKDDVVSTGKKESIFSTFSESELKSPKTP